MTDSTAHQPGHLSPEPARPLTSRECAKVLAGLVGALSGFCDHDAVYGALHNLSAREVRPRSGVPFELEPLSHAQLVATVGGLMTALVTWCGREPVIAAMDHLIAHEEGYKELWREVLDALRRGNAQA